MSTIAEPAVNLPKLRELIPMRKRAEVGRKLGVSRYAMSLYLAGRRQIPVNILAGIAKEYEVKVDDLLSF